MEGELLLARPDSHCTAIRGTKPVQTEQCQVDCKINGLVDEDGDQVIGANWIVGEWSNVSRNYFSF